MNSKLKYDAHGEYPQEAHLAKPEAAAVHAFPTIDVAEKQTSSHLPGKSQNQVAWRPAASLWRLLLVGVDNVLLLLICVLVFTLIPPFSDNNRYGVWKLGGEAGYVAGRLEAYVPLTFLYETTSPRDGVGRTALLVGAGLRYQLCDNIRAGLFATSTELQSHARNVTVGGSLRWTF